MSKQFCEVFPSIDYTNNQNRIFYDTQIQKVSTNGKKDILRIYLESNRLIEKKLIYHMQSEIKQKLFPSRQMQVKILEKYQLSSQYTPESLMDVYKESILLELRNYNLLLYNLFKKGKIEFVEENKMTLTLEDTIIATERSDELVDLLGRIICDRCGMNLMIHPSFEKRKSNKQKENLDVKIKNEISNIVAQSALGNNTQDDDSKIQLTDDTDIDKQHAIAQKENSKTIEQSNSVQKQKSNFQQNGGFGKKSNFKSNFGRRNDSFGIKKSDNPDVIYGRDFEEDAIAIETILSEMGEVTIKGQILSIDTREIRNEKTIISFSLSDFTDTIVIKLFTKNEFLEELLEGLKKKAFIKIKGITTIDKFDSELTLASITGIKKIPDFTVSRMDTSSTKRVELHCHTKMSDMDGVSDVGSIIKKAAAWGHKAIAITDHGAVQAFPVANHSIPEGSDIKIIYGVEAYLVDDLKDIIANSKNQSLDDSYVVFDLETTGLSPLNCKIIEIGAVKVEQGMITERFSTFVNPKVPIPYNIEQLTGIRDDMVMDSPEIEDVLPKFIEFSKDCIMVAHNAEFDMGFIKHYCDLQKIEYDFTIADTMTLAQYLLPQLGRYRLDTVAKALKVNLGNHHRAVDDAACTADIFLKFLEMLKERGISTLNQLNEAGQLSVESVRKLRAFHAIILAENDIGRINLYKLVSLSHLTYFNKRPKIPKSELLKYREGLILGSACEAGELYQALLLGRPDEDITRIVKFYDYLEIQPLGNNKFMLADDKSPVSTWEDLQNINKRIIKLGELFHKPVVGTCDVHFLDPEDEVYRRIILAGNGFKDADDQAPLYLRTTEEMLDEFSYLGSDKAYEIVVTNTNLIADMCERISPVRPDKCPPIIENSDQMLREICYNKAHEMYGENLPSIVSERLERELNSIISNGYAVMYIIAQKLVWKSNEDGYLVGSRGSVGSSFVATMSGVTEVNPLHAHYYCPNCHYSDFDSDEVKSFAGRSGCDMPDKECPVCHSLLKKDGFDIPFETFLGFKGNKEPDIDLNFSGDYQSKAHKYTEVIFGAGQTFRAGTIGTLADKTAFGYVKNYYEEHGVHKRNCEIDRIVQGCVGIRRTTGQHPGGIVVLPVGEEIYSFTPIQHPANDMTTETITTHFEYHSIDHNLLKLDILGHDDPTMIRMLEDLTGLDAKEIPLDDKAVMSLFKDTHALGITPEEINGCQLGALGIPEFGTDFAMGMLQDTKPTEFSDLIRIAGLSHGTDVWLGNAQTLIQEGKATISTAICTRDDIMIYLISMGMDSELSFTIMESVRKGKGLKDDWEKAMVEHGVPEWYIWSCKKIKYMFPKAHAAAYVMMAWRIAYCKVFYPLAYYASYFSIRATAFNYELMCQGKEKLQYFMRDYEKRKDILTKKEQDTYKDMKVVHEMYARGYEFMQLDLYRASDRYFQIIDGKLMPSFSTIDGLGGKAAEQIVEAAKDGKFLSKDDFRQRTKVSKTAIELMSDLGLFGELPQSNQLSLFEISFA